MALPLVLAGPVLRRVEPESVSVFMAFSEEQMVQLSIWEGDRQANTTKQLYTGGDFDTHTQTQPTPTVKIGEHLHLLVITANTDQNKLRPDIRYSYNLRFGNSQKDLSTEGFLVQDKIGTFITNYPLGYLSGALPSFVLPAETLDNLKIAHGSCRKMSGTGDESFRHLDTMMDSVFNQPDKRPQQLFLTGDQIYADEQSRLVLISINNLGKALFNDQFENLRLQVSPELSFPCDNAHFPPYLRQRLVNDWAKFTANGTESHLMSFAEYCAAYLHAWSIRSWDPALVQQLVAFKAGNYDDAMGGALYDAFMDEVEKMPAEMEQHLFYEDQQRPAGQDRREWLETHIGRQSTINETKSTIDFLAVLPRVTRLLANISTCMIFDDHEITDDWYYSRFWLNRVLTAPLGVQVICNGLMAYSLFQDWGNVPNEYQAPVQGKGDKTALMQLIRTFGASLSNGTQPDRATVLNPLEEMLIFGKAATETTPAKPILRWHYNVKSGPTRTYFLDTRTRREYDSLHAPPGLLPPDALNDQLPANIADQNLDVVFVISPVPILGLPMIEEFAQPIVGMSEVGFKKEGLNRAPPGVVSGFLKRDLEAWGFNERHLENVVKRLAAFKRVVVLSGDIHYGYSAYADYWKNRETSNHSRIIQLVASSFKAGWSLDFVLLKSGFAQNLLSSFDYEFLRYGWQDKEVTTNGDIPPRHRKRLRRNPVVLPNHGWPKNTTASPNPDWVWRLRVAVDESDFEAGKPANEQIILPADLEAEPAAGNTTTQDKTTVKTIYQKMTERQMDRFLKGRSRRLVWQPHVGVVSFFNQAGRTMLKHEYLYSIRTDGLVNGDYAPDFDKAGLKGGPFTTHNIAIDVTDTEKTAPPPLGQETV